jgi:hypothetical protein
MDLDITAYLHLARQRVDLGDGTYLALFDVFSLNHLRPDDPRGPVVRYLDATGPNRNIFRLDQSNAVLWRLEEPRPDKPGLHDPFLEIEKRDNRWFGVTSYQIEFELDVARGVATYLRRLR